MSFILLGLVQGLSEFFPISSSGHLVILKNLLKVELPGATFEAYLHFATILAVIYLFNQEIKIIYLQGLIQILYNNGLLIYLLLYIILSHV